MKIKKIRSIAEAKLSLLSGKALYVEAAEDSAALTKYVYVIHGNPAIDINQAYSMYYVESTHIVDSIDTALKEHALKEQDAQQLETTYELIADRLADLKTDVMQCSNKLSDYAAALTRAVTEMPDNIDSKLTHAVNAIEHYADQYESAGKLYYPQIYNAINSAESQYVRAADEKNKLAYDKALAQLSSDLKQQIEQADAFMSKFRKA